MVQAGEICWDGFPKLWRISPPVYMLLLMVNEATDLKTDLPNVHNIIMHMVMDIETMDQKGPVDLRDQDETHLHKIQLNRNQLIMVK